MRELEKEIEREVLEVESREKKKGEDEIYGYTCVVQKKQEKKKEKKKKKEFMKCIYMSKNHAPFSPVFSFFLLFLYQFALGCLFIYFSFLFLISNLILIPWIRRLCLSTEITLTIQIKNCFSLVFDL